LALCEVEVEGEGLLSAPQRGCAWLAAPDSASSAAAARLNMVLAKLKLMAILLLKNKTVL
jgi:hypothetical protein